MILHTVSAAPDTNAFRDCLAVVSNEDAILLLGDAVYAALPENPRLAPLLATGAAVHLLAADALAAGVTEPTAGVVTGDIEDFVSLTERYPRQMAWY